MSSLAGPVFNGLCAVIHASMATLLLVDDVRTDNFPTGRVYSNLVAFSVITCLFHVFYAVRPITYDPAVRFAEYFVTAALMSDVIALLCTMRPPGASGSPQEGVIDVTHVAILTATTMIFGYLEEKTQGVDLLLRPFFLGFFPYAAAWSYLSIWFFRSDAPDFVQAIFLVEFILFSCFGAVQYVYTVSGLRRSDTEMDGVYNLLSLISKSSLVLLCYGGIKSQS